MNTVELVLDKSRYLYYSIGMTDTKGNRNQEEIKRRIEEIQQELSALGPMRVKWHVSQISANSAFSARKPYPG